MNRRVGLGALLVLAILVGAYLSGARRTEGPPLDPRSTASDGAHALVELLGRYGDVDVLDEPPRAEHDTAIVLQDRFDRDAADEVQAWVEAGGTLIVASASSVTTPPVDRSIDGRVAVRCDIADLDDVAELDLGPTGLSLWQPPGATTCTGDDTALVVAEAVGAGRIVALGTPAPFTNDLLDEADNAVLAVALLAPEPGTRTAFLRPQIAIGTGDRSLVDLIDTPVRAALAQLAVAFGIVVLWRARRLGRPIREPQPVQIESAELTDAVGRLLSRSRHPGRAAADLRDRARRDMAGPLGLPLDAPAELVVATLEARTRLGADEVRRAAVDPVTTDDQLVDVARLLTQIREEITRGPIPAEPDRPAVPELA